MTQKDLKGVHINNKQTDSSTGIWCYYLFVCYQVVILWSVLWVIIWSIFMTLLVGQFVAIGRIGLPDQSFKLVCPFIVIVLTRLV